MEIKFRGKQVESGEWYHGFYVKDRRDGHYILMEYNGLATNAYSVDGNTIGQYTGLKDERGMEIFVGDIVVRRVGPEVTLMGTVIHIGGRFCIKKSRRFIKKHKSRLHVAGLGTHSDDVEVIGNIHDNPELLKEAA